MRCWRSVAVIAAVGAAVCIPARADNPEISVKPGEMTFYQAAAALGRATDMRIDLYSHRLPQGAPPPQAPIDLDKPARFNWSHVHFGKALRELCEHYDLYPLRSGEGYTVHPRGDRQRAPKPVPQALVEVNGVRTFVSEVTTRDEPARNGQPGGRALIVTFDFEWDAGNADSISHLQNVRLKDDLGHVISPDRSSGFPQRYYPDQRAVSLRFPGIDPAAKQILLAEGDVFGRALSKRHRVEVPYTGNHERVEKSGAVIELWPLSEPRPNKTPAPAGTLQLRSSLSIPVGEGMECDDDHIGYPLLVSESGKIFHEFRGGGSWDRKPGGVIKTFESDFAPPDEKPVRAVFQWLEVSKEAKVFSFSMKGAINIPPPQAARQKQVLNVLPRLP